MSYHASPFTDADTLHILIDSASVEKLLDAENVVVKRLLSYHNSSKLFEFERWGYSNLPVLKQIPEVKVVDDGRGTNLVDMGKRRILFSYRMEDVEKVAETV